MAVAFPYREKAQNIAADLRTRITRGDLTCGDRLPTRAQLRDLYGVTSDTLQRALTCLMDEGFVESAGRRGTFVSMTPPHLTNYALLFPNRFLPGLPVNRFYHALYQEAMAVPKERQMQICDGFTGRAGFLDYESLVEDMRQDRLAGVIFATAPWALDGTPMLADDGMPRTAIMSTARYPHIPAVTTDSEAFFRLAAERFSAAGRRRVAVFVSSGLSEPDVAMIRRTMTSHDLLPDDDLLIGVGLSQPAWAATILRLIFRAPPSQRPDALLIADDNMVEAVTQAIQEMGRGVCDDLLVIAQSNQPWPPTCHVPIIRIGCQVPDILAACLRNIDTMRDGGTPAPLTVITPQLDESLLSPSAAQHRSVSIAIADRET